MGVNVKRNVNIGKEAIGRGKGGLHTDRPLMLSEFAQLLDENIGIVLADIIVEVTYDELYTLKNNSQLVEGVFYKITDRLNYQKNGTGNVPNTSLLGNDRGIVYVQALTLNSLSKKAIRVMAVPQSYGNTIGPDTSIGVWHNSKSVVGFPLCIWGGKVWSPTTSGFIGTAIDDVTLSSADWVELPKIGSGYNYYEDKQFSVLYDFDNDWFEEQKDGNGNIVGIDFNTMMDYQPFSTLFNPCDITDWNCHDVNNGLYFFGNNMPCGIFNNSGSEYYGNRGVGETEFISGNSGDIVRNIVSNFIKDCTLTGSIYNNVYIQASSCNLHGLSNNNLCTFDNLNQPLRSHFYNNNLFISGATYNINIVNNKVGITIDITGATTVDLSAYNSLEKDVILTSTNATEIVNTIIGMSDSVKFSTYNGTTITFTNGGNLLTEGGISAVIDGSTGDWVTFEPVGTVSGKVARQQNIGTY